MENLGAAGDQFQTIDLTDNDLTVLGGFAVMRKVKTLMVPGNKIAAVSANLSRTLPNLEELVMVDNRVQSLAVVDRLASLTKLKTLALVGNPVTSRPFYRLYAIHRIPTLAVLDFERVKLKERREAARFFKSSAGKIFEEAVKKSAAAAPVGAGAGAAAAAGAATSNPAADDKVAAMSDLERRVAIEAALRNVSSVEELERLEAQFAVGNFSALAAAATATAKAPAPEAKRARTSA